MTETAMTRSAWLAEYSRVCGTRSDIQDHLPFLHAAAMRRHTLAELGVRAGNSTCALLAAASLGGGRLWSVDLNPPQVPAAWLGDPMWSFLQTDSTSGEAAVFLPARIDLLLIDTSHDYAQTIAELRTYAPRVTRGGGLVACHDTQWDTGDVSLPRPGGPVTAALDDYCAETGLSWANRDSGPGFYGMGVIWP